MRRKSVDKICSDVHVAKNQIMISQCVGTKLLANLTECQVNCANLEKYYQNLDIIWLSIEVYYANSINFIETRCRVFVEMWRHLKKSEVISSCENSNN